jgi:hypothetical protein
MEALGASHNRSGSLECNVLVEPVNMLCKLIRNEFAHIRTDAVNTSLCSSHISDIPVMKLCAIVQFLWGNEEISFQICWKVSSKNMFYDFP